MLIASLSGIRGVLNSDFTLADVWRFASNFSKASGGGALLLARDTRRTGPAIAGVVASAAMASGMKVTDFGVISTPALFRESRLRGAPAVMVSASHNEPEFNGLKFLVSGKGIGPEMFGRVVGEAGPPGQGFRSGSIRRGAAASYTMDLVRAFGEGSCDGVKVGVDLGGGAATSHTVAILRKLGCGVVSVNDAPGVFNRRIDPVADGLGLLREAVKRSGCDLGLGFDCDGDRLVVVDWEGVKRTGDFMLTFALSELLRGSKERKVVVSVDTTQAVDEVAAAVGASVIRTKVGEANVVRGMVEEGARLGGEGSSGGLIDGSFNYCRDSMLAALVIIAALKRGGRRAYERVPSYVQERGTVRVKRTAAARAIRRLSSGDGEADTTDGVKLGLGRKAWVLVRASGTEDLVRVSAEAETKPKAAKIVKEYSAKLVELSR